jgi:hypothetical protein
MMVQREWTESNLSSSDGAEVKESASGDERVKDAVEWMRCAGPSYSTLLPIDAVLWCRLPVAGSCAGPELEDEFDLTEETLELFLRCAAALLATSPLVSSAPPSSPSVRPGAPSAFAGCVDPPSPPAPPSSVAVADCSYSMMGSPICVICCTVHFRSNTFARTTLKIL